MYTAVRGLTIGTIALLALSVHAQPVGTTKNIGPCAQSLFAAVQQLVGDGAIDYQVGDVKTRNACGIMSTQCYGAIEKEGEVSFTAFYYPDSSSVRVIWAARTETFHNYGVLSPNPLVYQGPDGTENHVFELRFLPVTAYKAWKGDKNEWSVVKKLQSFAIQDIASIGDLRLESPTDHIAQTERAHYDNLFSAKGLFCTVTLKNGTSLACYLYSNYDKSGTLQWKGDPPAAPALPPGFSAMTLKLPGANYAKTYAVQKVGHDYILNGDIVVGDDLPKFRSLGVADMDLHWPNGTIPVSIDLSIYANGLQEPVEAALTYLNSKTELCYVMRTNEADFVHIRVGSLPRGALGVSPIGRKGGKQSLTLAASAVTGTVVHELLHSAGLYHEQCRSDRSFYINVIESNLTDVGKQNFQIEPGEVTGVYNYCSIMHYSAGAFAKDTTKPTIACKQFSPLPNLNIPKDCDVCMGQRDSITRLDTIGLDKLYKEISRFPCNNNIAKTANDQSQWRYCNKCKTLFYNGYDQKGICSAGGSHTAQGFDFKLFYNMPETENSQKEWRFCELCYNMFYDGLPHKGACAGAPKETAYGEHEAAGFNFVLTHSIPPAASSQADWRFCAKCSMLFYSGNGQRGVCSKGGGHDASGYNFVLLYNVATSLPAFRLYQPQWHYCTKCAVLFYDGYPQKGKCAAGGGHLKSGFKFAISHDVGVPNNAQAEWRYCNKCQSMFFNGYPQKGACPGTPKTTKSGGHRAAGFNFTPIHSVQNNPAYSSLQSEWRYCDKCKSMFFNGYPQKGTCGAGGSHNAQGWIFSLNYQN